MSIEEEKKSEDKSKSKSRRKQKSKNKSKKQKASESEDEASDDSCITDKRDDSENSHYETNSDGSNDYDSDEEESD